MKYRSHQILYALFIAVVFLLVKGYYFNTDDQGEHLPQVYQMLDAELYPHDYFVPYSNSAFTVRYYFEKLMLFGNSLLSLEWFGFLLTLFCISLLVRSVMGIAEEVFPNSAVKWLAPLLLLFVFYGFTVGGNHIIYPSLISSTMAKSAGAFSFWKFLQKRFLLAGVVLGVGSLFQPLVGLQLALLLSGSHFILQRGAIKDLLKFNIPFVGLISLIIVPVLTRQAGQGVLETELYWEIFYRFRNFHHYLPSLFPTGHFIKFFSLAFVALASIAWLRPKNWRLLLLLIGLSLVGMMCYTIALEGDLFPAIGKSQWFKTSVWIGLIGSVAVAGLVVRFLPISVLVKKVASNKTMVPAGAALGLFLLTNSALFPEVGKPYMIGNYHRTDLEKMHSWVRTNTPKDVVVLVSPNNNGFSCQAQRSIPIHFVAIVHEPEFMLNWYDLYTHIYSIGIDDVSELNPKEAAVKSYRQHNFTGSKPHIDLRLDDLSTCEFTNELGTLVHQEGNWVLTEFVVKD